MRTRLRDYMHARDLALTSMINVLYLMPGQKLLDKLSKDTDANNDSNNNNK